MSAQTEVWVIAEPLGDELHSCTFELIAEGRSIAEKRREPLVGIVVGSNLSTQAALLAESSVDRVVAIDHPLLESYSSESYTFALETLVGERRPSVVLLGATPHGSDLAPRLAMRVNASLVTDVVWAKAGEEAVLLELIKPVCDDKAYSTIRCVNQGPALATMRPGASGNPRVESPRVPIEVLALAVPPEMRMARTVAFVPADPKQVSLPEADYIVSGGRGIGSADSWSLVEELADALGAAVGGSRMAVDLGWIPFKRQVGQTGQTVAPKLYVALGISGASQHIGGVKSTKGVVAVNTDKRAAIFKAANLRVVGDLHEIVPALIARIRSTRGVPA
ncbi:MAG: electron transfer flavoprotein subunit alpha/FixB family protein [Actinobacteria bacterium]|nr:electron transfer flavoprotein subunit alpha/FixB family protein [Actinomycetota bacterium]